MIDMTKELINLICCGSCCFVVIGPIILWVWCIFSTSDKHYKKSDDNNTYYKKSDDNNTQHKKKCSSCYSSPCMCCSRCNSWPCKCNSGGGGAGGGYGGYDYNKTSSMSGYAAQQQQGK